MDVSATEFMSYFFIFKLCLILKISDDWLVSSNEGPFDLHHFISFGYRGPMEMFNWNNLEQL